MHTTVDQHNQEHNNNFIQTLGESPKYKRRIQLWIKTIKNTNYEHPSNHKSKR